MKKMIILALLVLSTVAYARPKPTAVDYKISVVNKELTTWTKEVELWQYRLDKCMIKIEVYNTDGIGNKNELKEKYYHYTERLKNAKVLKSKYEAQLKKFTAEKENNGKEKE
jgi:hypothetical protein